MTHHAPTLGQALFLALLIFAVGGSVFPLAIASLLSHVWKRTALPALER